MHLLQAGSFYIDYLLTVLTETTTPYPTYDAALDSFYPDEDSIFGASDTGLQYSVRECSPKVEFASAKDENHDLSHQLRSKTPLGSSLSKQAKNEYTSQTPMQYQQNAAAAVALGKHFTSESELGLTFVNIDTNRLLTAVQFNADPSSIRYRVQGKMYFKPDLRAWPFDKQQLVLSIEALDNISAANPEYIFCHMSTFSGLAPTIRLADRATQLDFFPRIRETCWPPFADPRSSRGDCDGNLACTINRAKTCDAAFHRGPDPADGIGFQHSTLNQASVCRCQGGKFSSSRYTAVIEYSAPVTQRFLKHYLPVLFISMITCVAHLVHYKETNQRLSICIGTLTALVLFHVSLNNQLPSSTRVTAADYVLMCSYSLNFITWGAVLSIMMQQQREGDAKVDFVWVHKVWDAFRWYGAVLWIGVYTHAFAFQREIWVDWDAHKTSVYVFWAFWVPVGLPVISIACAYLYRKLKETLLKSSAAAVVLEVESLTAGALQRRRHQSRTRDNDDHSGTEMQDIASSPLAYEDDDEALLN